MDPVIGSWGARSIKDGLDGQPISLFGGGDNRPSMEAFEIEYPVMFKRFQLWTDSGGPGKWRGGAGLAARSHGAGRRRNHGARRRSMPHPAARNHGRKAGQRAEDG